MAAGSQTRGAVVVTGASSGIGEACARRLAGLGFQVFAGVRKAEDGDRLASEIPGVTPLRIDVVDAESIAAAARTVEETAAGRGLAGLVNNAGVAVPAPIEHQPIDDFRRQIEVNLIGQVAVTQAFLPQLRAARGRIVNVSSIGGKVAVPLLGAYAASKFGLEGFSDTLRRELRPWGIEVSVIEPGTIAHRPPARRRGEGRRPRAHRAQAEDALPRRPRGEVARNGCALPARPLHRQSDRQSHEMGLIGPPRTRRREH
jgi:NAD(P)-dependent dehydrogenase (short-subunit alcohol dehydrogenase family)